MATPADRREYVSKNVTADLAFILEDAEVDEEAQYKIARLYTSVRKFANMADDRIATPAE